MSFVDINNLFANYSEIEIAKDCEYFSDIKSGIYCWYYPIKLKSDSESFERILEDFKNNQIDMFNEVQSLELLDHRLKYHGKISAIPSKRIKPLSLKKEDRQLNKKLHGLFLSLSILNKPIYIGKATRNEGSIVQRIKEHLSLTSSFAKNLNETLSNAKADLTIKDMLIRIIDLESYRKDHLDAFIGEEEDFALFVEQILINLIKPKFNIQN